LAQGTRPCSKLGTAVAAAMTSHSPGGGRHNWTSSFWVQQQQHQPLPQPVGPSVAAMQALSSDVPSMNNNGSRASTASLSPSGEQRRLSGEPNTGSACLSSRRAIGVERLSFQRTPAGSERSAAFSPSNRSMANSDCSSSSLTRQADAGTRLGSNEDIRRLSYNSPSHTALAAQGRPLRRSPSNKDTLGIGSLTGEASWTVNSDVTNASGSSLVSPPSSSVTGPDREIITPTSSGGTSLIPGEHVCREAAVVAGPSNRRGGGSSSIWNVGISRLMDSGTGSASSKETSSGSNKRQASPRVGQEASPRCGPDMVARGQSSPARPQGSEHALMAQVPSQQLQQLREEFRAECQAQVQMLRRVEEILRGELQTCRENVLDAVKAEAAERLEAAARMEKDWRTSLKEEATVRRAVATHLETRLGEFTATIEVMSAELQSQKATEVMPTLQENSNEEHLARLDEALEREALARQELENSLSSRFEAVAQKLFTRCQQEHQAQQSPEDERPKALGSESGRCFGGSAGAIGQNTGSVDITSRRHLGEDEGSVSLLLGSSWGGQARAGNSRMNLLSKHPQQNPQLAQGSQDWTIRRPVEMDGNIHRPVGSNQSPTVVPRTLSPKAHKPLLDQSAMANRGTNIRLPSATEETKPVGSEANSPIRSRLDFFHSALAVGSAMASSALAPRDVSRGTGT